MTSRTVYGEWSEAQYREAGRLAGMTMRHVLPRRIRRYGYSGTRGLLQWSPRQRHIMEQSIARFERNYGPVPPPMRGQIVYLHSFLFIESELADRPPL